MAYALGAAWPAKGRHEAQLALAGALRSEGFAEAEAVDFLCAVCRVAGDEDRSKREATCRHTWSREEGSALTGWTRLKSFVDPLVVDAARGALGRDAEWTEKTQRRLAEAAAANVEPSNDDVEQDDGRDLAFPVDVLPRTIHGLTIEQAEFTQVPVHLPAMLSIGASACSVAGKVDVEIKAPYAEGLNLFVLIALPSGDRKSPSFDVCFRPVQEAERRLIEAEKPLIARKKAERDSLERLLKKRQADYAATKPTVAGLAPLNKAREAEELAREIQILAERLEQMDLATLPKLLVDDCTIERLASIMAEQRGRLCVASDEGSILGIVGGRYAKDGKASFEVLLKGYSGTQIRVDRQSKDRAPVFVRHPRLTLCLAVQPCVVENLSRDPSMSGQGLLARFLYSLPVSRVGERSVDVNSINPQVIENYNAMIGRLQALPTPADGEPIPRIKLSAEALKLWQDFSRELEPRLHPVTGDLADIGEWAGKLAGQLARIAGVFHMVEWAEREPAPIAEEVQAETMARALRLGPYFIAHARRAFQSMSQSAQAKDAEAVLTWARRYGRPFTQRDLRRCGPGALRGDKRRLGEALELLEEQGRIAVDGKRWAVAA